MKLRTTHLVPPVRPPLPVAVPHLPFSIRRDLGHRPPKLSYGRFDKDVESLATLGFPVDKEICQPRLWRGRVEGREGEGWWLVLVEIPVGQEVHVWMGETDFPSQDLSIGTPVSVITWLQWIPDAWIQHRLGKTDRREDP